MKKLVVLGLVVFGILTAGTYWLNQEEAPITASLALSEALGNDTTGYARALAPRPFVFPQDHGPHPDYKLEWWYYTGNLATSEGRRFGYQFTIFRSALAPPDSALLERETSWATNQLYFAHFAISDIANEKLWHAERFSRGAAGLAGATADPFRVWIEDWQATQVGDTMPPMRIQAAHAPFALDLKLEATKPIVLQGEDGWSPKGPGIGNASYYYSMTRLAADGTVTLGDETFTVTGTSWMDREWSTSFLSETQTGWDWFSIQLDDGRDLMFFQVREQDGTTSPYTDGLIVAPDGSTERLTKDQVALTVLDTWTSPHSGGTYPSGWRMEIPDVDLDVTITPFFADQELQVSVDYWEGAVRIEGSASGLGYVELTGYSGKPLSAI